MHNRRVALHKCSKDFVTHYFLGRFGVARADVLDERLHLGAVERIVNTLIHLVEKRLIALCRLFLCKLVCRVSAKFVDERTRVSPTKEFKFVGLAIPSTHNLSGIGVAEIAQFSIRPLVVDADVVVAEADVIPADLVAVLHRLAVAVDRILDAVNASPRKKPGSVFRSTESTGKLFINRHSSVIVPFNRIGVFLVKLIVDPLQVLIADRLVPVQQMALVAFRAVREERLLVEVLVHFGRYDFILAFVIM